MQAKSEQLGQDECTQDITARTFIRALRDYRNARAAWSGNVYGVVATFPLREGRLYEVARAEGRPSKRAFVRRFWFVEHGKMHERTPEEALAWATERGDKAA